MGVQRGRSFTYDAAGNVQVENVFDEFGALARVRTQLFSDLGRLWQTIGAAGSDSEATVFEYDTVGNLVRQALPLGRTSETFFDELRRPREEKGADGLSVLLAYDALDRLVSVTDPKGGATTYSYNAFGEIRTQLSPDSGETQSTYLAGNKIMKLDARGASASYGYDALGRLTGQSYSMNGTVDQAISLAYDDGPNGKGRITSASDSNHALSFGYDVDGNVISKTQTVGGVSRSVAYGYIDGALSSITTPSGQAIAFEHEDGQLTRVTVNGTTVLQNIRFEPFGPIASWSWGNGTSAARAFDLDGRITQIESAGFVSYSHAADGTITSRLEDFPQSYALANGLTSTSIEQSSNRIVESTGLSARSYEYDAAGNIISAGGTQYEYNAANRMRRVTSSGIVTTYTYNALGERIRKSSSNGTSIYVYDELGHLLGEYSGAGALVSEYVWVGDLPVAVLRPNGSGGVNLFYVHTDHLNTPRRITRPSDNVIVWRWDSDPFGAAQANQNPSGLGAFVFNLRFPGQYYDAESGLNYNYFRDYDPATGRYVQSDPIGLKGGLNTYAYVGGNPLSAIDPRGLHCKCVAQIPTKQYTGRGGGEGYRNLVGRRVVGITCAYTCTRSDGSSATVTGSHQVSFWFEDGYELACIGVEYTQKIRPDGTHIWMDPIAMPFDPASSASPELRDWAQSNCKCK